jgi:hypothetical protein
MSLASEPGEPVTSVTAALKPSSRKTSEGILGTVHLAIGRFLEIVIEGMVVLLGRRVRRSDAPWLDCPLGDSVLIGTGIYEKIAADENLTLRIVPDAGLIADFDALRGPGFDPAAVQPRVRHFYEHASQYQLEAWSEIALVGRFFLWLLVEFISQRMDQLNFPLSPMEMARGMTSQVIQLREQAGGSLVYTGWLRKLKSSGLVMFAGIYSVARIPGEDNPCVKVTFPDRGSANVYLVPLNHTDGSFGLDSSGSGFGKSGFYRVIASGKDHLRVRNFKTLHELFHVYEDQEGVLRTDHKISFLGMTIVRLHYKMTLLPALSQTNEHTSARSPVTAS